MSGNKPTPESSEVTPREPFAERHYTVGEIGELWTLSDEVVRKLFDQELGVLVIGGDSPRGKRRYTTLRIPQSVVERVHRRLRNL